MSLSSAIVLKDIFGLNEYCGWGGNLPPMVLDSKVAPDSIEVFRWILDTIE
jgi:hypothetical protein